MAWRARSAAFASADAGQGRLKGRASRPVERAVGNRHVAGEAWPDRPGPSVGNGAGHDFPDLHQRLPHGRHAPKPLPGRFVADQKPLLASRHTPKALAARVGTGCRDPEAGFAPRRGPCFHAPAGAAEDEAQSRPVVVFGGAAASLGRGGVHGFAHGGVSGASLESRRRPRNAGHAGSLRTAAVTLQDPPMEPEFRWRAALGRIRPLTGALITVRAAGPGNGAEKTGRFGPALSMVAPRTVVQEAVARSRAAIAVILGEVGHSRPAPPNPDSHDDRRRSRPSRGRGMAPMPASCASAAPSSTPPV